jgi:outer membrane protein assembly factor BamB
MTSRNGAPRGPREPDRDVDLEARVVGYLRDAPDRAPDHLLAATAVRVHATRQRGRRAPGFGRTAGWAVVAAAVAIALVVSLRFDAALPPGIQESAGPTTVIVAVGPGREPVVRQRTATPTIVRDIMVVDGNPWAVLVDGLVFELDPETGEVISDLDVQLEEPTDVAAGAGSVWVGSGDGTLVRVDTASGTIQARVPIGIAHHAVAASDEAVWVAGTSEARRIDASTLEMVKFDIPPGVVELAAVGDEVWATYATGVIVVADGQTGAARATLRAPSGSGAPAGGLIAAGGSTVWLTAPAEAGTLVRIEPGVPELKGEVGFDPLGGVSSLAADAEGVWILFADDGVLVRVEDDNLAVADTINVGLGARGIGFVPAGLALWGAGGVRVLDVAGAE